MGPRRRGLHIPRFRLAAKARSFRRASSSSRTRFAGLRSELKRALRASVPPHFSLQQRTPSKLNNVTPIQPPEV